MTQYNVGHRSIRVLLRLLTVVYLVVQCSGLMPATADESQVQHKSTSSSITAWIERLQAPDYEQRKEAFLELCNPALDIDDLVRAVEQKNDLQLTSMIIWLKRIRSLSGPIDVRLDAICDFTALAQGSVEVIERYANQGKLDLLLEMVRLVPRGGRDMILQNGFTRGENTFDHVIEKAWEIHRQELIPQFLDAMLPMHPVRLGLNRRWSKLGLGEPWRLQVALDTSDMQIAALESEGQVEQAVQIAKQTTQPLMVEKILLRNQRWQEWLELDPSRLSLISAAWSELPRVLILESLDRHEEAVQYYEMRKKATGSAIDQQLLLTQLAMVTGDMSQVFSKLKEHSPDQLMGMYFLHNRIDELLDFEGLSDRNTQSLTVWLDRNVVEGKGLSKVTRFQSLFLRLGEPQWSDTIQDRIVSFIESHASDQQIRFWKDYLQQAMRYGLDEKRAELLALATSKLEIESPMKRRSGNALAGFPEAQVDREMTIEDLFRESFPYMKEAAYPLYRTMRRWSVQKSDRQILEDLQMLHQGMLPEGFEFSDVRNIYRGAVTQRILDGFSPNGTIIDLAEAFDAMGLTTDAIEFLEGIRGAVQADLMRSQLLWKRGEYQQARKLVLECLSRGSDNLEVYQWTSQVFEQSNDREMHKLVEQQVLGRPSGMEDFARYSQEMRRTERFELSESIGRFLEVQFDSFPSSLGNIWLDDIYWGWNLSLLANHYHQTSPDFPQRLSRNFDLSLTSCLFDLFNEFDSPSGMNLRLARGTTTIGWDLDWTQWAWRYERVFAGGFWQAVQQGDRDRADRFLRTAHRINPEQINTLIDVVPLVLEKFDRETLKEWFLLYYNPMQAHLKKYPGDTMISNNCAWLAVKCGFEIDRALELTQMVTARQSTDTYLDTRAEAYFVQGDIEKAIEISLECQRLNPRDPHHRRQLDRYNRARK